MGPVPLVAEQIEVGARFLDEFRKFLPVQAAFWLKESESPYPVLYVASDQINEQTFDPAIDEMIWIVGQLQEPWFNALQVTLLDADDPLAKAVMELIRSYGGKKPIRLFDVGLALRSADELYVYPSPVPAAVS
jgi:hypothetical protein